MEISPSLVCFARLDPRAGAGGTETTTADRPGRDRPRQAAPGAAGREPACAELSRRLRAAAALSLPVGLLALQASWRTETIDEAVGPTLNLTLQWLFASAAVLWAGLPVLRATAASICRRSLDPYTPAVLACLAALVYSLTATLWPWALPAGFRTADGRLPVHFDIAAFAATAMLLLRSIEARAQARLDGCVTRLAAGIPTRAHLVTGEGDEFDIPCAELREGQIVRVRPGERVPADGVILEGHSRVDESALTGDSREVEKSAGDRATCAAVNAGGTFTMRIERPPTHSLFAVLLRSTLETVTGSTGAGASEDHFCRLATATAPAASAAVFVLWSLSTVGAPMDTGLLAALAVAIAASPCLLQTAAGVSERAAVVRAAAEGVWFAGGSALRQLARIDTLVVGSAATLGRGAPHTTGLPEGEPADAEARKALRRLRRSGVEIVAAAEEDPHARAAIVGDLQRCGRAVAVAAGASEPCSLLAEVALATDAVIEPGAHQASVRIPAGDLRTIARARAFALAGVRKARLIRWATGLHAACALPLAAGLAYPFTGVMWSPLAALALLVSLCALSLTSAARLGPVFS